MLKLAPLHTIGHKNKGGNWELDVMAYPQVPFNKSAIENFEHTLNSDKPVIVLEQGGVGTSTLKLLPQT